MTNFTFNPNYIFHLDSDLVELVGLGGKMKYPINVHFMELEVLPSRGLARPTFNGMSDELQLNCAQKGITEMSNTNKKRRLAEFSLDRGLCVNAGTWRYEALPKPIHYSFVPSAK